MSYIHKRNVIKPDCGKSDKKVFINDKRRLSDESVQSDTNEI